MGIQTKSILQPPSPQDGFRILLERAWPRGVDKKKAQVDLWLPEAAISRGLAKWFAAHSDQAMALRKRYFADLGRPKAIFAVERLYFSAANTKRVTLLHSKINGENSAAVMLKDLIDGRRKPPTGSGPARAAAARGQRSVAKGSKR